MEGLTALKHAIKVPIVLSRTRPCVVLSFISERSVRFMNLIRIHNRVYFVDPTRIRDPIYVADLIRLRNSINFPM